MPYNYLMNKKNFMNDKHPITPPDELVEQWYVTADNASEDVIVGVAKRASRWGWGRRGAANEAELQQARDEELEACCLLLDSGEHAATYGCHDGTSLRAALATPPPTDEELDEIERQCLVPVVVTNDAECDYICDHRQFARAVLERWGNRSNT